MRRLVVIAALAALLCAPGASGKAGSWAQPQIKVAVAHGLLARSVATFRPDDPLTRGALADLVAGLTDAPLQPSADPAAPATVSDLDASLVRGFGLGGAAHRFYLAARAAGLAPPARFGTEVTARMLELRYNHPAGQDNLELLPSEPATRAEAAYSAARALGFSDWQTTGVDQASQAFEVPELTAWQQRILHTAVQFIGYPYVWGGESETSESPFGAQAHGGFDCSGFVWRVYKLQKYAGEGTLAATLRGRTTYDMSGEVPRAKRIPFAQLQPADVLFFGNGPRSKPAQVGHTGIYLGNGWFIHSSDQGVYLSTLTGWYRSSFAWGRRPLAEAGLTVS
jgi:cell wall-associated NlpC family hydrolase